MSIWSRLIYVSVPISKVPEWGMDYKLMLISRFSKWPVRRMTVKHRKSCATDKLPLEDVTTILLYSCPLPCYYELNANMSYVFAVSTLFPIWQLKSVPKQMV